MFYFSVQIPSISETINELHTALGNNPNERELLYLIQRNLNLLRSQYRDHINEFSIGEIEFLQSLTPLQDTLTELIDAIEEKKSVLTRDHAQDLVERFSELKERLNPHLVAKRAEKEIRELVAEMQSLPCFAFVSGAPLTETLCVKRRSMEYMRGNVVEHPTADWGQGIVLEDSNGTTVKIGFEKVGIRVISLQYVQPNIVDTGTVSDTEVKRIAEKNRIYVDEPFVDIFQDIKSKYPEHLVIIENGYYFEVFEQDAEYFSNMYGWRIYERQIDVPMTGFPRDATNVWVDLNTLRKPYVLVSQLPNPERGRIQRRISKVFP